MKNYDDFDLKLNTSMRDDSIEAQSTKDFTIDIIKSAVNCTIKISNALKCTNVKKECRPPTKGRPASSRCCP